MVIVAEVVALLPQLLFAFTDKVPLAAPGVAVIELLVDVPVQPEGKIHVYDVAPGTAITP